MNIQDISNELNTLNGWQSKYRQIMMYGKKLPALPEALKIDSALVAGCESKVWLHLDLDEQQNKLVLIADSDTRIVKGLIAIILACYNGKTPAEALNISAFEEFEKMDLLKHLSPSRGNGVKSIVELIQDKIQVLS